MRYALRIMVAVSVLSCAPEGTEVTDRSSPHFGKVVQKHTVQTLPDGKQVRIVGVAKGFFTEDDTALILTYITDYSFGDRAAIEREADKIWQVFRHNVEQAGLTAGLIMAQEARDPSVVSTYRHEGFIWRKLSTGHWEKSDK